MELDWLEDFAALAELGNFSRAAGARHVSQPAFSRRIKALEDWVGVPLFNRAQQGVTLTAAGEAFRANAEETIRRVHQSCREAREAAGKEATTLRFAATHALSFSFFPHWIRGFDAGTAGAIRLVSDHLQACEELMLRGEAQFLLCHQHDDMGGLPAAQFRSLVVGKDMLVPLVAPDAARAPRWRLPGTPDAPARHLAYSPQSGLGRIVASQLADTPLALETVFTSHLAAALQSMARDGSGIAWLPMSLAEPDLEDGRLVRAGEPRFDIPLEIRLFRPQARQSRAAEALWRSVKGA
jgi:LysR family transcriptional regulator, hypochlorite-specific transcription factor HypT